MRKGPTRRSRTELTKNDERVSSDATNSMECDAAAVGMRVNPYDNNCRE